MTDLPAVRDCGITWPEGDPRPPDPFRSRCCWGSSANAHGLGICWGLRWIGRLRGYRP